MTDPFDIVREALDGGVPLLFPEDRMARRHRAEDALASIEERLRLAESLERQANNKSQFEFDRAEAAERERDEARFAFNLAQNQALRADEWQDAADRAEAENERLREALLEIAEYGDRPAVDLAFAALPPKEDA